MVVEVSGTFISERSSRTPIRLQRSIFHNRIQDFHCQTTGSCFPISWYNYFSYKNYKKVKQKGFDAEIFFQLMYFLYLHILNESHS